jgi:hypothetical protein
MSITKTAQKKEDQKPDKPCGVIFKSDAEREDYSLVYPENKKTFELEELQAVVGGLIEFIYLPNNRIMVINEEGKFNGSKPNTVATLLVAEHLEAGDRIFGDVLLTHTDFLN